MVIYKEQLSTVKYKYKVKVDEAVVIRNRSMKNGVMAFFLNYENDSGTSSLFLGNNRKRCKRSLELIDDHKNGGKIELEFSKFYHKPARAGILKILRPMSLYEKTDYFGVVRVNDSEKYWFHNSIGKKSGQRRKLIESTLRGVI